ncbi:unnamed protein product [Symbiodinium sp. CCMP2592]|nr:unnamed protein product [Symbiodinium sp. CCMP2592]
MSGSMQGHDGSAVQQFREQQAVYNRPDYQAVQDIYWTRSRQKRSTPTPVASSTVTPQEEEATGAGMDVEGAGATDDGPSLLQPFSLQDQAALEVTAGHLGVDINQRGNVEAWLQQPVANNKQVFDMLRVYHERVIRPEYYALVCQLEAGLKTIDNRVFAVRQELSWMSSENRLAQKHACGLQLLTTGWPEHMSPADRVYMVGWMISQVEPLKNFLVLRGFVTDHTAHEMPRFLNVLSQEPTTIPAKDGFFSTMTLLTFKSWDTRQAFIQRYGGSSGVPVYKDEATPVHGKHVRVAPSSPQWQRKLEAPLRIVMGCINKHPDHAAQTKLTILWKSLTIMAPQQDNEFHADATAWARLFYSQSEGTFQGRLEVVPELSAILSTKPPLPDSEEPTLWSETWNQIMWGTQLELDKAEAQAFSEASRAAAGTGKGLNMGKGKRHWSQVAIHANAYEPYPFELTLQVVDQIYFAWDEYCDKFRMESEKIGDYSVATTRGKPPAGVGATLRAEQEATFASTTTPFSSLLEGANSQSSQTPITPTPSKGGKGGAKGKKP